jgi:o-succinylbenzoate synthase
VALVSVTFARLSTERATMPEAATPRGQQRALREGVVLALEDDAGRVGLGSAAPLPGFSVETLAQARAELEALRASLVGESVDDAEGLLARLDAVALSPSARHAVEQAVLDLASRRLGFPVPVLLGARVVSQVATHRLVRDADDALAAVLEGSRTLKVKVGRDGLADDDRRVAAIRQAVGPEVAIRLDANGAWSEADAVRALALLCRHGIALCEEPVRLGDLEALARVRRAAGVPLGADESCRDMAALEAHIAAGAVDAVVLKPMLIGGPRRTLAMARRALRAGLAVIVTTSFETAVGWQAARWVAEALPPENAVAAGLDAASSIAGPPPVDPAAALPNPIRGAAIARPEHPAVVLESGLSRSYAALADDVARAALALAARGLGPQSVIALVGPADAAFVRALHAIGWLGATAAPLALGPELARDLEVVAPDAVLADAPELLPRGEWQALPLDLPLSSDRLPERAWPFAEPRVRLLTSGTTATPAPGDAEHGAARALHLRLGYAPGASHGRPLAVLPAGPPHRRAVGALALGLSDHHGRRPPRLRRRGCERGHRRRRHHHGLAGAGHGRAPAGRPRGPPVPGEPPRHLDRRRRAAGHAAPQARRHRSARRRELGHERGRQPGRDHLPGRPLRGRAAAAFRSGARRR